MRSFNKMGATFWGSGETGRLLKAHPEATRLLAINLFTNQAALAEPWGLYHYPRIAIMEQLAATPAKVAAGLSTLAELRFAVYDPLTEWVWVINMAARQLLTEGRPLAPRDNMAAAANRWYRACPRNPFLGPYFDMYVGLLHLENRRDDGGGVLLVPPPPVVEAPPVLLELEAPLARALSVADQRVAEFDQFWAAYHRKGRNSRPKAREAWMKKKPPFADVMAGLERWLASQRWAEGYIVDAAKWITEERWLEAPEPAPVAGTSQRTQDVIEALDTGRSIFDLEGMVPEHIRQAPKQLRRG